MINFLAKLYYLTKGKHKALVGIASLFIFISLLEMLGTGLIGPFIVLISNPESIINNDWINQIYLFLGFNSELSFVILLGLLVIIAFYLKAFLSFISQKKIFNFSYNLKGELSYKLLTAYLEAPYSYHLKKNSAEIIQNVINLTDQFCLGILIGLLVGISNLVVILGLISLLVWTNIQASLIIAGIILLIFIIYKTLKHRLARWGKESYDASLAMIRVLNHGLGSIKETRIIGCERYFQNEMRENAQKYAINSALAYAYGNLPRFVIETFFITFLVGFALLFVTFNRENSQNLTGILGIFTIASIRLLPATSNLVTSINVINANIHVLEILFLEINNLEKLKINFNLTLSREPREIKFHNELTLEQIVYRYSDNKKNVLNGISLSIKKGESIGIVGRSGSGKTTLIDVLMGFLIPQSGDIKSDGISVYNNLRSWQNLIGYVPQSIFLMDDTLERNIAFGVPDHLIDQDKLNQAIETAQLSEVVKELPQGIKTCVGERGVLLSGGQRQRVGIARALYHEREILIFDEATAALDNETENLVTEATKALSGIKTIIIIAHRLSTIEHCDRIYQIDQGSVIKSGNYQEVVLKIS